MGTQFAPGDDGSFTPEVRGQLLETFDEMAEVLRSINGLAERRGFADDWWSPVHRLIALRVTLQMGPPSSDFAQAMDNLCLHYDMFVETVLPDPRRH